MFFPFSIQATTLIVAMDNQDVDNTRSGAPCVANIKIDADGSVYVSDNTGAYGAAAQVWLDLGLNTRVWVERTINSGTLTTDDIGASRVALTTDKELGVTRTTAGGPDTANVTVTFYNAASGGAALDTAVLTFSATRI